MKFPLGDTEKPRNFHLDMQANEPKSAKPTGGRVKAQSRASVSGFKPGLCYAGCVRLTRLLNLSVLQLPYQYIK